MTMEAKKTFINRGVDMKNIHFELFASSGFA